MADGPLRWGILGTGLIAETFTTDLKLTDSGIVAAVGSRTQEAADRFAQKHGIGRAHSSYESLVADPEIDVVYVATPHPMHRDNAILALEAGKPVLVEKPFTMNAVEAREIVAVAREKKLFAMEAMWTRFLPHMMVVRDWLTQRVLGEIVSVSADHGQWFAEDPDFRLFAPALGGGALLDLGIYPVSLASMATGGQLPERVEAVARMTDTGVDAQASMLFVYPGGAQATISTSLDVRTANSAAINGTEGRILIPQPWARTSPVEVSTPDGTSLSTSLPHQGHGLRHQAAEVHRLLREGLTQSPVIPLAETLAVMRTLDMVRERIGLRYPGEA